MDLKSASLRTVGISKDILKTAKLSTFKDSRKFCFVIEILLFIYGIK